MKLFVNNNRGLTLVEVLATVLITTIIISTIYSVFTMGIKSYKKIGIEGELRDEANYMIARILSEIYKISPESIQDCGGTANCFKVVNTTELKAEELKTSNNEIVGYRLKEKDMSPTDKKELTIKIENNSLLIDSIQLNSENILVTQADSTISYDCTNKQPDGSCLNAIIRFNLTLQNKDHTDPASSILFVPPQAYHSSIGF